jgi:4-amino-4-deoxychorismate lyase
MTGFSLIETLCFEPDAGFIRLRLHLARLTRSARRVGFPEPVSAAATLSEAVNGASQTLRVRLTLDRQGRMEVTTAPFARLPADTLWTVRIANSRLDSNDKLLRVKTTNRAVYDAARAEYASSDADEVIMLNQRGEVCEGTITSVFLDDGSGILRTPPISCGLLAGVLRTELICQRKARVGRISVQELRVGSLHVGNSLRGLIAATLVT